MRRTLALLLLAGGVLEPSLGAERGARVRPVAVEPAQCRAPQPAPSKEPNIFTAAQENDLGDAVAVLNLDSSPSDAARAEIEGHPDVTGVDIVRLPTAGEALPWLDSRS